MHLDWNLPTWPLTTADWVASATQIANFTWLGMGESMQVVPTCVWGSAFTSALVTIQATDLGNYCGKRTGMCGFSMHKNRQPTRHPTCSKLSKINCTQIAASFRVCSVWSYIEDFQFRGCGWQACPIRMQNSSSVTQPGAIYHLIPRLCLVL